MAASAPRGGWPDRHLEARDLVEEVASLVSERSAVLREGGADAPRLAAAARRKLATLAGKLDALDGSVAENEAPERERARRAELVALLRTRREQLVAQLSGRGQGEDGRASLLQGGVNSAAPVRGTETESTAGLDDRGVLRLQQAMMQEQDDDLSELERAVAGTKHVALTINDELDEQNRLLDDLDEDVDAVGGRLRAATRRIGKVSQLSGNCAQYTCMLLLIAVLVVLIVVSLKG